MINNISRKTIFYLTILTITIFLSNFILNMIGYNVRISKGILLVSLPIIIFLSSYYFSENRNFIFIALETVTYLLLMLCINFICRHQGSQFYFYVLIIFFILPIVLIFLQLKKIFKHQC